MASIVLRNFGGMAPSANPKSLPEAAATYVRNLDLRFGDFRPLAGAQNIGTASAGATLYKMEGNGIFITRPGVVNFVRGPIPNDPTERTYYSGDGAPKVIDLNGSVRQLGVPAPANAPTVQTIVNDEFSEADAVAARNEVLERIKLSVLNGLGRGSITGNYVGPTNAELGTKFIQSLPSYILNVPYAAFKIPGAMSGSGFIPTNPSHNNLNDPRLGFRLELIDSVMTAFVPLLVRIDSPEVGSNMLSSLTGTLHPITFEPIIKTDLAQSVVDNISERIKVPNQVRDQSVARIRDLVNRFTSLADSGDAGSPMVRGQIQQFYARADIDKLVEAAITRAVSTAYSAMRGYAGANNTNLPVTGVP
jgi:hypothetical protein